MTTLVARQPLHPLSMSSTQRAPRRLSARLREREDAQPPNNGYVVTGSRVANGVTTARTTLENVSVNKKRKIGMSVRLEHTAFLEILMRHVTDRTSFRL